MPNNIKWSAQLDHVQEVSLLGAAALGFWNDRLSHSHLLPIERDGKAQIMIIAAASKFHGVRFQELSISILAHPNPSEPKNGAYLAQAWNSNRFFAWCERLFFKTPYSRGDVRVSTSPSVSIELTEAGQTLFRARMCPFEPAAINPREPSSAQPVGWEGPVYLPTPADTTNSSARFFFAHLAGHTQTCPFLPDLDSLEINPTPQTSILAALNDSHFTPTHWEIRQDAHHAKSKTYTRALHSPIEYTTTAPA